MVSQIKLLSTSPIGKQVLMYAYISNRDAIHTISYLSDFELPCFDGHITKDVRKELKFAIPSVGSYLLSYTGSDERGYVITMAVARILEGANPLKLNREGEIIHEVTLSNAPEWVLQEFVNVARTRIDETMHQVATRKGMVTRYVFHEQFGEWEVLNDSPKRPIESVFIDAKAKQELVEFVQAFVQPETRADYFKYSIPYKCNILLHGKPGTGKTSTIHAIASLLESDVCVLNFTSKMDDSILAKALNGMHHLQRASILVIEDIDCLFVDRKEHDTSRNSITMSGLLNAMDGMMRAEGILVFMTTNNVSVLDAALLRPGRIDKVFRYDPMKRDQVHAMFSYYLPHQVATSFEPFYKRLEHKDVFPSLLQEFFFRHRKDAATVDICTHVDELLENMQQRSKLGRDIDGGPKFDMYT